MKNGLLSILAGFLLLACGDGNVVIAPDPQVQFEKDSITIMEYLLMKGYDEDQIGNSSSGVRYVILDSGSTTAIDESDFVEFNYIGQTLGDTIFDTSIAEIGDSLRVYYEENPYVVGNDTITTLFTRDIEDYEPLFTVYSASGWSITDTLPGLIPGFINGVAATFKHLKVGGRALILIPSSLAYGGNGIGVFIAPNVPIAFELRPVKVTKQ